MACTYIRIAIQSITKRLKWLWCWRVLWDPCIGFRSVQFKRAVASAVVVPLLCHAAARAYGRSWY